MRLASAFCALLALGGCQQSAVPASDARNAELIQQDFMQFCEAGAAAKDSRQIVAALEAAGWYEWPKDEAGGHRAFSNDNQINHVSLERWEEVVVCRVSNPMGSEAMTNMLTDWLAGRPGVQRRTEASQMPPLSGDCRSFDINGEEYAACSFGYNEGISSELALIIPAGSAALEPPGVPAASPRKE
ncbi:hypothetical protein [Brevundimonas sp.]|uniref:hypothetical protein n=1 Tax=Brevundimonas sp. TaxID=1871086 RepID=UPI001D65F571|nr:hypothetical protein [Brevundimonas sp.]MBL0947941.1 hypothetical protein [Brevundimonas sp.]